VTARDRQAILLARRELAAQRQGDLRDTFRLHGKKRPAAGDRTSRDHNCSPFRGVDELTQDRR